MAEKKDIHILFKVVNFVYSLEMREYNVTPIDKHILIILSKHHGEAGIYPSICTIAKSIDRSERYTRERLTHLEGIGLITIDRKIGKSSHYLLNFIDQISSNPAATPPDVQILGGTHPRMYSAQTPDVQTTYPAATPATINIHNQNRRSEQREKKKHGAPRLPLSDFFKPDEQRQKLVMETCSKCSISEQHLMAKFRALQKTKDKVSSDWNADLELFLINERPSREIVRPQAQQTGPSPTTAAYKDYFDEEKLKERDYWEKKLEERKRARQLSEGKK